LGDDTPYKGRKIVISVNIETANSKEFQLYNLKEDIGQQNNLAETNKEKLQEMIVSFESIRGKDYNNTAKLQLK